MTKTQKKVRELLANLNITEPPVPVEEIAKKLDAQLSFDSFDSQDDISGVLYRDNKRTVIGINSFHPKTRQRFSIAHEIGHLLLHSNKNLYINKAVSIDFRDASSSLAKHKDEIQANQFAAELLMPPTFIEKELILEVNKKSYTPDKALLIGKLSKTFGVSEQAMEYRLINLGYINAQ